MQWTTTTTLTVYESAGSIAVVCVEHCQASAAPCYRHSGKARRGDGNDVTPNPAKLYATGKELRKLVSLINAMCPPGELPTTVRARTLREKNKYASRICRLKKKAQHEANKIKLYGLEQEHRMYTLCLIKMYPTLLCYCFNVRQPIWIFLFQ